MDTEIRPSIEVKNLTKEFSTSRGLFRAVDNVSFKVSSGKICGFVGPNGAGKSTTIKLLLGLLQSTSGDIKLNGGSINDSEIRKIIGYMPEKDTFYEDMNAKDYLLMMASLSGLPSNLAKKRTETLINTLGLEEAKKRAIGRFSSGMKKKISFAQAIIHNPKILILDEPTANLDPIAQEQLIGVLKEMCKKNNTTVLISSHHIEELEKLIDDIIVINHGRIILDASLNEIKQKTSKTIEILATNQNDVTKILAIVKKLGLEATQTDSKVILPAKQDAAKIQKTIMQAIVKENINVSNMTIKDESLWDVVLGLLKDDSKTIKIKEPEKKEDNLGGMFKR